MQRATLSVLRADDRRGEQGFTLLEVVCVMAIIAILAAIALPTPSRATSKVRLESYAYAAAALLKADRNAAKHHRIEVATVVNPGTRVIRSGVSNREIRVPDDVLFEAVFAPRCNQTPVVATIRFFPSGMSCGGVIALSRLGHSYEVRVNWLTGGIEIATLNRS